MCIQSQSQYSVALSAKVQAVLFTFKPLTIEEDSDVVLFTEEEQEAALEHEERAEALVSMEVESSDDDALPQRDRIDSIEQPFEIEVICCCCWGLCWPS